MIEEVKGNLFDAPKGALIVHACNTQGVWGAGIASHFARLYPDYYKAYAGKCTVYGNHLLGTAFIMTGKYHRVGCLFTSTGYGSKALYREDILNATRDSLLDMFTQISEDEEIHLPRINSGLFRVPWPMTKKILEEFPERKFVVWVP
jgi:ADP-ribose 1''-phosphate phosphatase